MKVATERKVIRWFHILASIPVIGYMYGPVSKIPEATFATKFILFPLIVLSGVWMWKRQQIVKWIYYLRSWTSEK